MGAFADGGGNAYEFHVLANASFGAATGYASLDDAITALAPLTEGDAPAAGIVRAGDRYLAVDLLFAKCTDKRGHADLDRSTARAANISRSHEPEEIIVEHDPKLMPPGTQLVAVVDGFIFDWDNDEPTDYPFIVEAHVASP